MMMMMMMMMTRIGVFFPLGFGLYDVQIRIFKDDYYIHYYQEEDARKLPSALPGPRYGFLLLIENR